VTHNKSHEPNHTALFLILLIGILYHTTLIQFFEVEEIQESKEMVYEAEIVNQEIVPEIESIVDTLPEAEDAVEDAIEVEVARVSPIIKALERVKTSVLKTNLWRPYYDTCGVGDLAKGKKFSGSNDAKQNLWRFFEKLNGINANSKLHVFHFGDSQIEGDRITGRIRSSWQRTWGGSGPGLIPAVQPIPSLAVRQQHEGDIKRFTKFGRIDTTLEHTCYGGMASLSRIRNNGKVTIKPHPMGFRGNQVWNQAEVLIGSAPLGGSLSVSGEYTDTITLDIPPTITGNHSSILVDLAGKKEEVSFSFEGVEIEITGIRLGSESGLAIHNIPMRSSSGTVFKRLNTEHFKKYLQNWDVGLVILQFGGNTAPYVKDEAAAKSYGRRFRSQLKYLKTILPESTFLVIGPSDMGITSDSTALTYPMLGAIRAEMKKVTILEEGLYWDVFEAMGGAGTMEVWAKSSPKLASSDLVHFTPKGAKKIGELLDQSFRAEYRSWEQAIVGE
jgi:lysophospholipase L1-like esterase